MTSPDSSQSILEERARILARPPVAARPKGTEDVLSFRLAREMYAVETRFVFAVFQLANVTPLPGAELPLYGLTGWRGDVLTVLDLRRALGAPTTALDDLARVIVLGDRRAAFGILADELGATISLLSSDIFPIPEDQPRPRDYLRGITRDAMLMLDAPQLLRRQAEFV